MGPWHLVGIRALSKCTTFMSTHVVFSCIFVFAVLFCLLFFFTKSSPCLEEVREFQSTGSRNGRRFFNLQDLHLSGACLMYGFCVTRRWLGTLDGYEYVEIKTYD